MIVTVINRANPSHVIQFTAAASFTEGETNTAIVQDSTTYTFANADYKFITINAGA